MIGAVASLTACWLSLSPAAAKLPDPVTYLLPAHEKAIVVAPFLLTPHNGHDRAIRMYASQ